jgi:DNA gyrase/topoisomerase IV subunit A
MFEQFGPANDYRPQCGMAGRYASHLRRRVRFMAGDQTPAEQLHELEMRLHIVEALVQVMDDPHRFVDTVLSDDTSDPVGALRDGFGFSEVQARASLDMQFRSLGKTSQSRWRAQLDDMRAERQRRTES